MKSWFQASAYPSDLVQKELNKVKIQAIRIKMKLRKSPMGYH